VNIDYRARDRFVGPDHPGAAFRPQLPDPDAPLQGIDIERVIGIVRRQWRVVTLCAVAFLILGGVYLATAVPLYTSVTRIVIDTGNQKIVDQLSTAGGIDDEASVLSQVEILRSERLAKAVTTNLGLASDARFLAQGKGALDGLSDGLRAILNFRQWFTSADTTERRDEIENKVIDQLILNLAVQRVGRSYVLELSYRSPFPDMSATIAEAYGNAYLTDQLDSKYDATRRASEWLQLRIAELRQKSLDTDMAVQKFRTEKGLIATDGQLITEQQLTQLNSQLIIAQGDAASANAKYRSIQSILDTGEMDGAVTEVLSSTVINDLQQKFLEASRKEADISSRLGPKHVQAVRLRTEMSEYRRLMFAELSRIAQTYKSTYEVALVRVNTLEDKVAMATGISASANDSQVQLRELEREAETYKNLYQTFLTRYQEAMQQQSFPITEARIISQAKIEKKPSSPKKPLTMAVALFLGIAVGAGIGAFREFRDRFFRTGDQIREELGLEFLGTIPASEARNIKLKKSARAVLNPRHVVKQNSIASYVLEHPLSAFAEALRSAKIAIDVYTGGKKPKVIGIVSVLPGEGKSTVSMNLAELLARQGARVLLVDADLRNPGATRMMAQHADIGLVEVLQRTVPLAEALLISEETKLAFLPAVVKSRIPYSSELIASEAMTQLLRLVSDSFEYIIFDLPPLAPVVDARAIAPKLDLYLLVVEWGKTSRSVIQQTMQTNGAVAAKCAGVILNKVDSKKMKLYQTHGSSDYYSSQYASYYRA
jgi:succinoglycan biosynthesis transport protein ExoP